MLQSQGYGKVFFVQMSDVSARYPRCGSRLFLDALHCTVLLGPINGTHIRKGSSSWRFGIVQGCRHSRPVTR